MLKGVRNSKPIEIPFNLDFKNVLQGRMIHTLAGRRMIEDLELGKISLVKFYLTIHFQGASKFQMEPKARLSEDAIAKRIEQLGLK